MAEIIPFKPNSKTHDRRRKERRDLVNRLAHKIGINHQDAPLYSEELRFLAYQEQQRGK